MARRAYRQSGPVVMLASMSDYLWRFGRFLMFTIAFACATLVLAAILGILAEGGTTGILGAVQIGLNHLFDFVPPPAGAADSNGAALVATRLFGFALTCLYAGFSVAILSEPINVIRFSRHAVVDFEGSQLRIAYWVRLPEWKYLTHATAEVFLMREKRSDKGPLETKFIFRWDVPREDDEFPQNEYASIRGVRYFEIPLNAESDYKDSVTLLAALDEFMAPESDVVFSVVVQGVGLHGEAVQATKRYAACDVLCGYDFVSIRKDDVMRTYERALERADGDLPKPIRGVGRAEVLFYEHFNCVNRMEDVPDTVEILQAADAWAPDGRRCRYHALTPVPPNVRAHDARPDPLFLLEFGECAERGFRLKELAVGARERLIGKRGCPEAQIPPSVRGR